MMLWDSLFRSLNTAAKPAGLHRFIDGATDDTVSGDS